MLRVNTSDGLYHDANPQAGEQGTIVTAAALNAIQEEIIAVITRAGATLDPSSNTQLRDAILAITGGGSLPWGAITNKPVTFPPSAHQHAMGDVIGLVDALGGKQSTLGYTPVQQGTGIGQTPNAVKIGWSQAGKLRLTVDATDLGYFSMEGHKHGTSDVTGLDSILAGKATSGTDVNFNSVTASSRVLTRDILERQSDLAGWIMRWVNGGYSAEFGGIYGNPGNYVALKYTGRSGVQAYADGSVRFADAGVTMQPSGLLEFMGGGGSGNGITKGNGDAADFATANLKLQSWYGIGFGPVPTGQPVPSGQNSHWFNTRTGDFSCRGDITTWGNIKIRSNSANEGQITFGVDDYYVYSNATAYGMFSGSRGTLFYSNKSNKALTVGGDVNVNNDTNFGLSKNSGDNCLALKAFSDLRFYRTSDGGYFSVWHSSNFDPSSKVNRWDYTNSLGQNGWRRGPDGVIEQWGKFVPGNTWSSGSGPRIGFPLTFPNACLNVQISEFNDGGAGWDQADDFTQLTGWDTSGFNTLLQWSAGVNDKWRGLTWRAIGY